MLPPIIVNPSRQRTGRGTRPERERATHAPLINPASGSNVKRRKKTKQHLHTVTVTRHRNHSHITVLSCYCVPAARAGPTLAFYSENPYIEEKICSRFLFCLLARVLRYTYCKVGESFVVFVIWQTRRTLRGLERRFFTTKSCNQPPALIRPHWATCGFETLGYQRQSCLPRAGD